MEHKLADDLQVPRFVRADNINKVAAKLVHLFYIALVADFAILVELVFPFYSDA
jgi:hypothetical protein